MDKALTPAAIANTSNLELPHEGGTYFRDAETGKLTRIDDVISDDADDKEVEVNNG